MVSKKMNKKFLLPTNWSNYSEIDDVEIEKTEKNIKKIFPLAFKNLVKKYNGGVPKIANFQFTANNQNSYESIDWFLNLKEDPKYFSPPEGLLSFSKNEDGSFSCFDYRKDPKTINPPVIDWHPPKGKSDFLHYYFVPPEGFPKGLIAFGGTGGGDFICFDYRNDSDTDNPPIVYWDHEAPEDESVYFLANNFDEFLDMLYEG